MARALLLLGSMSEPFGVEAGAQMEQLRDHSRGVPARGSRPGAALPISPPAWHGYPRTPLGHLGWAQGVLTVADADPEPGRPLPLDAPLAAAAARLVTEDAGLWPVTGSRGELCGVVFLDGIVAALASGRLPSTVGPLVSTRVPTCTTTTLLHDAVREMLATWISRLPVVDDAGHLEGQLTLARAAAAADRDPSVRDLFERAPPTLFARRFR